MNPIFFLEMVDKNTNPSRIFWLKIFIKRFSRIRYFFDILILLSFDIFCINTSKNAIKKGAFSRTFEISDSAIY